MELVLCSIALHQIHKYGVHLRYFYSQSIGVEPLLFMDDVLGKYQTLDTIA